MLQDIRIFIERLIIHSQLWVAFMAFILTHLTLFELGVHNIYIPLSVAFITWGGYTYIRSFSNFFSLNFHHYKPLKWFFLPATLLLSSLGIYLMYKLSNNFTLTLVSLASPALLVFLYPLRISQHFSIREIPGFKLMIISFSWVWLTSCIPYIYVYDAIYSHFYIMLMQRFLFVVVWTLPFDIRDLDIDLKNLQTIPQNIGVDKTKYLLFILIFLLQLSYIISAWLGFTHLVLAVSYILGLEVLFVLTIFSHKSKDNGYYSFLVESLPMFVLFFCLLTAFFY